MSREARLAKSIHVMTFCMVLVRVSFYKCVYVGGSSTTGTLMFQGLISNIKTFFFLLCDIHFVERKNETVINQLIVIVSNDLYYFLHCLLPQLWCHLQY